VLTGTPPSKRKVSPLVVAPIGMLATLVLSAWPMKPMIDPLLAAADGMKCVPCACTDAGFVAPADPARKSGSCPGPKMNSSAILPRRPLVATVAARDSWAACATAWACSEVAASSPHAASAAGRSGRTDGMAAGAGSGRLARGADRRRARQY